jgi:hypothetical protein
MATSGGRAAGAGDRLQIAGHRQKKMQQPESNELQQRYTPADDGKNPPNDGHNPPQTLHRSSKKFSPHWIKRGKFLLLS